RPRRRPLRGGRGTLRRVHDDGGPPLPRHPACRGGARERQRRHARARLARARGAGPGGRLLRRRRGDRRRRGKARAPLARAGARPTRGDRGRWHRALLRGNRQQHRPRASRAKWRARRRARHRRGLFANDVVYPSDDEMDAAWALRSRGDGTNDEFVWRPSYPALSFLLLIPFVTAGIDTNYLYVACLLAAMALILWRAPSGLRP